MRAASRDILDVLIVLVCSLLQLFTFAHESRIQGYALIQSFEP